MVALVYSKLEEKLLLHEKKKTISSDEELIKAIKKIIKKEESRPFKKRDFDLIDEAVEALLSLQDVDADNLDEIALKISEKHFDEIRNKEKTEPVAVKKKRRFRSKLLIPAVALFMLIVCSNFGLNANLGFSLENIFDANDGRFKQLEPNTVYRDGNTEIMIAGRSEEYTDFGEMLEKESIDNILYPTIINGSNYVVDDEIGLADYGLHMDVSCDFNVNGYNISYSIEIPCRYPGAYNVKKIGDFEVSICKNNHLYQGSFIYDGNKYYVKAPTYSSLKHFIENLENYKK